MSIKQNVVPPHERVVEGVARKLFGIESVPRMEARRMIKRAIRYLEGELYEMDKTCDRKDGRKT